MPLKALVLASLVGQVPVKSRCKQKGVSHVVLENKLTDSYGVVTILMCIMGDVQIHWIFVFAVTTCDKFLCAVKNVGAEAGSVQNPTGFYKGNIMNFERSKFNSLLKKIA